MIEHACEDHVVEPLLRICTQVVDVERLYLNRRFEPWDEQFIEGRRRSTVDGHDATATSFGLKAEQSVTASDIKHALPPQVGATDFCQHRFLQGYEFTNSGGDDTVTQIDNVIKTIALERLDNSAGVIGNRYVTYGKRLSLYS